MAESSGAAAFVMAILIQAVSDLRPGADPFEHAASLRFFTNTDRHFEYLCGLVDVDHAVLQRALQQRYPELFRAP